MSIKPLEFQWFGCGHGNPKDQHVNKTNGISMNLVCSPKPNRDLVVRDQKMLPEVRNRLLLPRDFSAIRPYEFLS